MKKEKPVLLILGNPPYSGHSSNKGDWIRGLIDDYKQVDGKPLGEKNPKRLQDDYVKFLRYAQWKIEQAGRGVVGMITNHSYLDNPTFRGMRQSLLRTFDDLYVLDLHGNALKKETAPDGSLDQNVFDIRQGSALAFFVKRSDSTPDGRDGRLHHAERFGAHESKYDWLRARPGQHRVKGAESSVPALSFRAARRGAGGRLQPVHAGARGVPRAQRRHRDGARQPDHSLVEGRGVEHRDRFLAHGAGVGPARVRAWQGCAGLGSGVDAAGCAGFGTRPRTGGARPVPAL